MLIADVKNRRYPNLFIVGAPKCGTTAMSHYLAGHPDVYMSEEAGNKEPEYFATDFKFGSSAVRNESEYLSLFDRAPPAVQYLGEASVSYLFSKAAVPAILQTVPDARLIAMVRNPIEIARALHNQNAKMAEETVVGFEQAWRLQQARSRGLGVPTRFSDARALCYGDLAKVGAQLARLLEVAPRECVHVVVVDDMAEDPASVYAGLLAFLGLPNDGRGDFRRINESMTYKSAALQQFMMKLRIIREHMRLPGGLGLHKLVNKFNLRPGTIPMDPSFKRELQEYFADDVKLLSQLLGRDLTRWTNE